MLSFTQTAFSQPADFTLNISSCTKTNRLVSRKNIEIWDMKMVYWIQNADLNLGRSVSKEQPKRENKVRTLLPSDSTERSYARDFHHYDDVWIFWMAVSRLNLMSELSTLWCDKLLLLPTHSALHWNACSGSIGFTYSDQLRLLHLFLRLLVDLMEMERDGLKVAYGYAIFKDYTGHRSLTDEPKLCVSVDSLVNLVRSCSWKENSTGQLTRYMGCWLDFILIVLTASNVLGWRNAYCSPPPITGILYASLIQSDIEENYSPMQSLCFQPQDPDKDIPPPVDIQNLSESDLEDPNSTTGSLSFSCSENVKSPINCFDLSDCDFYNCVVSVPCKSKAASVYAGSRISPASVPAGRSDSAAVEQDQQSDSAASRNRPAVHSAGSRISPASVPAGRSDSAASRNRPAVHSAGAPNHAGWSKRPATVSAGRSGSAGWLNPAARPYFRPSSVYFNTPTNLYDPMFMDKGRWDTAGDPSTDNDIGIVDSGCSRSMTGNKDKLADFVPIKGGIVKFGGGDGRISGKGTIRTSKLDFENVYYVEELQHFNLFSVSQICDKKNKVLFTDTDCLVLSEEFQLPDASQVVLRIPRKHDLYTFHISHLQPEQKVTCLVAKASLDESTRWHRRMAHVNFKTINKLAKEGLVDGLPLKVFSNEHNCVACNKGKQHKASYKHISAVRFITDTLQLLHMDLFGPTNIRSIDQKYYSLVVTDDFSRFSWTFFLGTKDETFYVLKEFITLIENQLNKKVKGIRCDNGTEFKNAKLIELCGEKGIKRDYSNPRTPQQNGVAERKNRTLIEAGRTMLADSKLPTMFWTEAVSTACYVLNRVSITNPHHKTPYELISGKVPQIGHLKPFGCQVTIFNTSDHLGKFEGKADEGYLVGYASNSKSYRVYNLPNKRVEETMNLRFLTDSLGYTRFKTDTPAGSQETNINAGIQDHDSDSEVDEQVIVV
ncbi:putative ribonuclease H-like domain-containing protein, partial [Tanacetum coccineum]